MAKTLEDLVQQAMSDGAFVQELQADPAAALQKHGYPTDPGLVAQIKAIDFDVFRQISKNGANVDYC